MAHLPEEKKSSKKTKKTSSSHKKRKASCTNSTTSSSSSSPGSYSSLYQSLAMPIQSNSKRHFSSEAKEGAIDLTSEGELSLTSEMDKIRNSTNGKYLLDIM